MSAGELHTTDPVSIKQACVRLAQDVAHDWWLCTDEPRWLDSDSERCQYLKRTVPAT